MRKLIAALLAVIYPSVVLAAERPSAMLYAIGTVTVNGVQAAGSTIACILACGGAGPQMSVVTFSISPSTP